MYSWETEMEEEEEDLVGGRDREFGGKNVLIFLVDGSARMQVRSSDPSVKNSLFRMRGGRGLPTFPESP